MYTTPKSNSQLPSKEKLMYTTPKSHTPHTPSHTPHTPSHTPHTPSQLPRRKEQYHDSITELTDETFNNVMLNPTLVLFYDSTQMTN